MENFKLIELPKILDDRGNLSFFENNEQIPFIIERVYWIYDIPGGALRRGHAFKETEEFVIAISGSFDLVLQSGSKIKTHHLNRAYKGVYIPAMTWRHIENFSTNSVALISASKPYDENDYIRDFEEFEQYKFN